MRARSIVAVSVLAAGALAASSAMTPVRDSDLYWQLALARDTLAHGLVRADTYSWTARGAPVSTDQWLGQIVLYAGYLAAGWLGVLAVRVVGVAVLVFAIVAAALVRRPRRPLVAIAIALPAILLSRFEWTERPELFGAVLFALVVLLLQLPGERPLVAIAALLILWANVHGSFALGAGIVALVALHGLATDRALRRGYLVALAGAAASCVLTPAGLGTLGAPGFHLLQPPREIQEWAIPDPTTLAGAIWALLLGLVLATAALTRPARARDVILLVPLALLSLIAIRHTPLFAIAATPFLADRSPAALRAAVAAPLGVRIAPPARGTAARAADLALGIAGVALLVGGIAAAPRSIDEGGFPVAALSRLPAGPGLFAQYDWGGWLIWNAPATPVFVDGRLTPFLGPVMDDYRTVLEARPGWRDVLARRHVRWILVRPRDPVAVRALDLGWSVLSRGPAYVLIQVSDSYQGGRP
ncbi:MAG: hypothetical protein KGJ98_07910 [Chloroflexota bacterium]|nr:hypothetical protein [Chloroflexota bacterium]